MYPPSYLTRCTKSFVAQEGWTSCKQHIGMRNARCLSHRPSERPAETLACLWQNSCASSPRAKTHGGGEDAGGGGWGPPPAGVDPWGEGAGGLGGGGDHQYGLHGMISLS